MRTLSFISAIILCVFAGTLAEGQTPTPTPLVEYNSMGGTGSLPDASWTKNGNGTAVLDPIAGGLRFNDADATIGLAFDSYYEHAGTVADSTSGWTVIIRARELTSPSADRGGGVFAYNPNDLQEGYIGMQLGRHTSSTPRPNYLEEPRSEQHITTAYDLTQWHTYRYVCKSTGVPGFTSNFMGVFIDENPLQFHTPAANPGMAQGATSNYLRMGLFAPTRACRQEVVVDYIQLFGEMMSFPTPPPTPTPTSLPCTGGLVNCGFEAGNTSSWTVTGGGSAVTNGSQPCSGGWAYEGYYSFFKVANGGSLSGSMYQTVTPGVNVASAQATCYARNADGCQTSTGTVTVGIDPAGGTDVTAGSVQWGTDLSLNQIQQQASSPVVNVTGGSPYTVFIKHNVPLGPSNWTFVNIDGVQLNETLGVKSWDKY